MRPQNWQEVINVKKLIAVVVALAAGAFVFSKVRSSRQDTDLWHEATNS